MTGAPSGGGRPGRAVLAALFLLSGATSLVYEVSWTRRLVLLVGSTSGATAVLLAAFMLGLALGAALGGPRADRSRRPLLLYAGLEAAAAAAALVLPFVLDGLQGVPFLTAAGREPLLLAAAFLVLLVPTTFLGATLPALARAAVDDPARAGPRIGMLYAANTLGAVAGALGAGFALVEALGVDGSARAAVAVNLAVAAAAWRLGLRAEAPAPAPGAAAPGEGAEGPSPAVLRAAAAAAFAGGFAALAAEVAWTRLLVFTLEGFTAAFAAMLGAFLLGSALGGAWFGRVAGRTARPLALLGWLQVGAAVAAAGTAAAMRGHYDLVRAVRGAVTVFGSARADHDAVLLVSALLVMGPPAFLMGGIFPAAAAAAAGGLGDLGARVGRVYAANTVGAVLGSLAAGFAGIPLLGAGPTAVAVAGVSLLAGLATLAASASLDRPGPPRRRHPLAAAAAGAVLGLAVLARPGEPMILRSHVFLGPRGREHVLEEAREGKAGLASVVRNVRNGYRSLYTDGFLAASTEGRYRYMRMLGHVPMVLAEDPRRVLVMAFGTGTTAGSLSTHPSVDRLDVVEISPEVLEVAPRFASVNRGVLDRAGRPGRPEVRVFVEDARRFVLARPETWDVITLEPLMPYTPGAVHLYTREFYALCRARLSPGGAMCQWFPIHAMASEDFRSLAAAFVEVFPESSLWVVEETAALVGTTAAGPRPLPVARSSARLSAPGPREDLEAGKIDDLAQWWSFRMCGGRVLREWIAGPPRPATAMTDEHPDLEFRPLPEGSLMTFLHDNLVVALDLRDQEGTGEGMDLEGLGEREAAAFPARYAAASAATAAAMDARASLELVTYHGSLGRLASDPAAMARHDREAEEALRAAVRRYGDALQANPRDRIVRDSWSNVETLRLTNGGRALLRQGRPDGAEEAYAAAVAVGTPWNADEAWTGLGRARLRRGRAVAAREALERALALFPGNRDAQALLGEALVALGRPGEARAWFERAYEGGSGPADEDAATREARDAAMRAEASAGRGAGEGGPAARDDREVRAALAGALEEAAGPPGPLRDRAAERVRGAKGREAEVLADLLGPHRRTVLDPAAPGPERVRSLSLLAAARDPGLGDLALALPPALAAEGPYAAAFVDALAEAGEVPGLAGLLDPARGAPPAVRARAADRLAGIRDPRSVDAALAALEDPEASVRTAGLAALFRLAGWKEFDPDAPAEARRAAAAALRDRWTRARASWR